ncbi:MAG: hypothetical protein KOO69_04505 [Victivallales bacterium]|nr:hypothetical protein [Victivallales bacterium]
MKRLLLAAVLALSLVACVCNEKQSAAKCGKAKVSRCAKGTKCCVKGTKCCVKGTKCCVKAKTTKCKAKVAACPEGCKCAKCKAKAAACSTVKASKCSK